MSAQVNFSTCAKLRILFHQTFAYDWQGDDATLASLWSKARADTSAPRGGKAHGGRPRIVTWNHCLVLMHSGAQA